MSCQRPYARETRIDPILDEGGVNHFPAHFAPAVPNPHSVQNADFPLGYPRPRADPAVIVGSPIDRAFFNIKGQTWALEFAQID